MRVRAGVATDIGRVRERNEDAYLVEAPLFAVADGMGGHLGGEVASRLAVETLERRFRQRTGDLRDQVLEANRMVFERSISDRSVAGMGTTLTALLIGDGGRVRLIHIGDSRAYLLRSGELRLLTEDHTLVRRMVQEGQITHQEAAVHPQRNILTRVLGVEPIVEPDEGELGLLAGDRLLLCTDGLTGMVGEDTIGQILSSGLGPPETAEELVRRANAAGGVDNTTVIVLDAEEGDDADDPPARSSSTAPEAPERARPAGGTGRVRLGIRRAGPSRGPEPVQWIRIALWVAAIVALVLVGLIATRSYLDRQWYVGVANGHVAVYRGIPTRLGGFDLHHVVQETSIPAADAERLATWRDLDQGITASDLPSALAIVEQIRADVASMPASGGGGP